MYKHADFLLHLQAKVPRAAFMSVLVVVIFHVKLPVLACDLQEFKTSELSKCVNLLSEHWSSQWASSITWFCLKKKLLTIYICTIIETIYQSLHFRMRKTATNGKLSNSRPIR